MRSWPAMLAAAALTVALAGCSDDDDGEPATDDTPSVSSTPTASETPTPTASETSTPEEPSPSEATGTVVTISIEGDRISPAGERLQVERDEPVTLEITSDRAGELHVHSKPEQYVEFEAGPSSHELVISAPGIVDVEDHETGHVIVQLEVT